jgi:hypothetical protein
MSFGSRACQEKPEARSSCSEQIFQPAFFAERRRSACVRAFVTHPGKVLSRSAKNRANKWRENRFMQPRIT